MVRRWIFDYQASFGWAACSDEPHKFMVPIQSVTPGRTSTTWVRERPAIAVACREWALHHHLSRLTGGEHFPPHRRSSNDWTPARVFEMNSHTS